MLNGAKPLSTNNSWDDEGQSKSPKMKLSDQKGALCKPLREEQRPTKCRKEQQKPLRRRVLIEEGLAKSSKKQHSDTSQHRQVASL